MSMMRWICAISRVVSLKLPLVMRMIAARAKPAKLTLERQQQLRRLAETGEPVHELAKAFGISRATAYRYVSAPAANPAPESTQP